MQIYELMRMLRIPRVYSRYSHKNSQYSHYKRGITLLLVILVLTALLSISLGIFNVVFTELRISGEISDSFAALYAADEAIEWGLYLDRIQTPPLCNLAPGLNCYDSGWVSVLSGACYRLRADKTLTAPSTYDVTLKATGEFRCGAGASAVKRALLTNYGQTF